LVQDQYFCYFGKWLSSPAPSIFVVTIILFIFIIFLKTVQESKFSFNFNLFSIVLLSVFAITVKISSLVIFLLPLYILMKTRNKNLYKSYFLTFSLALLFIVPFVLRNLFLSGYLLYPVPYIDIFSFDWKIPIEKVEHMKSLIFSYSKTWSYDPNIDKSIVEWLPIWLGYQWPFNLACLSITFLSPFILLFYHLFVKKSDELVKAIVPFLIISFIGVMFWFFTAPDFRYAYDFLWINVLLSTLLLFEIIGKLLTNDFKRTFTLSQINATIKPLKFVVTYLFIIFFIFNFSEYIWSSPKKRVLTKNIILPEKYNQIEVRNVKINNFNYFQPVSNPAEKRWGFCWNNKLPCAPNVNKGIELRGKTIENGFRRKVK